MTLTGDFSRIHHGQQQFAATPQQEDDPPGLPDQGMLGMRTLQLMHAD